MRNGEIVANGTPQELLREHSDAEVAALMDMPRRQAARVRSLLEGTAARE
jgi:ABC-type proline/glycine betaine transport system ATPase subunit